MAVQAQQFLLPDYCNRFGGGGGGGGNVMEEQQFGTYAAATYYPQHMFYEQQESNLTWNASGCRKRPREQQQQPVVLQSGPVPYHSDHNQSSITSTSGRPTHSSNNNKWGMSVDAFICVHNEKVRQGVEEVRKKQRRMLVSLLEQHIHRRLEEKEAELEVLSRRNAELEEKIKWMATENHIWFSIAKNNEALVAGLRASLDQALLQNNNNLNPSEGCGESSGEGGAVVAFTAAGDAMSCCVGVGDKEEEGLERCKACREGHVRVLVLPCRHLCLCTNCHSAVDTCPVCSCVKSATVLVSIS